MKKRTACFGWTKKLQRRVENARRTLPMEQAIVAIKQVRADHRARIEALLGGA
jgi:hypothetical protein